MKTKLLFFCSRLGGGGAEMHLVRILNEADFSRYDIHLALTRGGGNYEALLDERITCHYLSKGRFNTSTVSWLRALFPLRRLVRKLAPEAVISVMDPQNLLLSMLKAWSPRRFPTTILMCQNAPSKNLSAGHPIDGLIRRLMPVYYNRADKIIAISKGVRRDLEQTFNVRTSMDVIYNAGFGEQVDEKIAQPLPAGVEKAPGQLVACGRLTRQKGFDVLFDALARIKEKTPFSLWLLGAGKDEAALREQAQRLGLTSQVHFLGFQSNPFPFFHQADAFVLSSRWEGFGNVIVEAMVSGAAVLATRCDYGPDEIITHEKNGLLTEVEDAPSLARDLERLLTDDALRQRLAAAGKERAQDFRAEAISRQYFERITAAIPKRRAASAAEA